MREKPIGVADAEGLFVGVGLEKLPGGAIGRARTANDDPGSDDARVKPGPVAAKRKPSPSI